MSETMDRRFYDSPPETGVEMQSFIVKPDAEKTFHHIHKDFALSYLFENEIKGLRNIGDLVALCDKYGLKNSKKLFLHETFTILNSARSRKGFERKMLATNISKSEMRTEDNRKDRFGFLRR